MHFSTTPTTGALPDHDCLILGVYKGGEMTASAKVADRRAGGALSDFLAGHSKGWKAGSIQALYRVDGITAEHVVLVGLGERAKCGENAYRSACRASARYLNGKPIKTAVLTALEWRAARHSPAWKARQAAMVCRNAWYRFESTKPSVKELPRKIQAVYLPVAAAGRKVVDTALTQGCAIAEGQLLTRELGNTPPNICTPQYLVAQARKLARGDKRFKVRVLDEEQMRARNMGALLAVAQGSREPPALITIEYRGRKHEQKPIALVGKGVTFDTGGISIKPANAMDEMKFDMSGAGSVLGTLKACAEMNLPQYIIGVIPTVENMPDGKATRPGDVVTTASGKTVEILNTDAEGRLILCDALTHARRFKPRIIIDIATLTGACVAALGKHASGLFTQDTALERDLLDAGVESWDRLWTLPLWDDYQSELDSNFADIANIGKRYAGATTAACFLSRFVEGERWAHLDIAGTAWNTGAHKGATGRPVPLLTHFLLKDAGRQL